MSLKKLQRDWEYLGRVDPLFAVLTDQSRKNGKWDAVEFFLSGEREIGALMDHAAQLGHPSERQVALDFGCGVGRLTRALAAYFEHCYGVDISQNMVAKATELNGDIPACRFLVNSTDKLSILPDSHFDLIYSNLVLQHIPNTQPILSYIAEFVRTLKEDGLLVFQVPSSVPLWQSKLQPRKTLFRLLRVIGLDEGFIYEKLSLYPISMTAVPRDDVLALLRAAGGQVLKVQLPDTTYFVTK